MIYEDDSQSRGNIYSGYSGGGSHGTFSPGVDSRADPMLGPHLDDTASDTTESIRTIGVLDKTMAHVMGPENWKRWLKKNMRTKKMGQTSELAEQAGFRDTPLM